VASRAAVFGCSAGAGWAGAFTLPDAAIFGALRAVRRPAQPPVETSAPSATRVTNNPTPADRFTTILLPDEREIATMKACSIQDGVRPGASSFH
jgi:hypothetical protein